jgi:hypothetical protein
MSTTTTSLTRNKLDDYARWGLWALPVETPEAYQQWCRLLAILI